MTLHDVHVRDVHVRHYYYYSEKESKAGENAQAKFFGAKEAPAGPVQAAWAGVRVSLPASRLLTPVVLLVNLFHFLIVN